MPAAESLAPSLMMRCSSRQSSSLTAPEKLATYVTEWKTTLQCCQKPLTRTCSRDHLGHRFDGIGKGADHPKLLHAIQLGYRLKGLPAEPAALLGKRLAAQVLISRADLSKMRLVHKQSLDYHAIVSNVAGFLSGLNNNDLHSPNASAASAIALGQLASAISSLDWVSRHERDRHIS
jgi:hypothetical protein